MPSKKIISTLIICAGAVISVWLFVIKSNEIKLAQQKLQNQNIEAISENSLGSTTINVTDDWKKILTSTNNSPISILTNRYSTTTFDDTSKTAQFARDFLAQYLNQKKNGATLTTDQMNKVVSNTLANQQYTEISGAVYIQKNLHIIPATDRATVQKYKDTVNASLKNRSSQIQSNSISAAVEAVRTKNSKGLEQLDPIIRADRGLIEDFLNMEVPNDAVKVHLDLLNSFSNLLADLEAIRAFNSDPVRGISGMGGYNRDVSSFSTALNKINLYFSQKLVSPR